MGRAENRKTDKKLKSRLTPEQFEHVKSELIKDEITKGIDRFAGNVIAILMPALTANRISEERATKIVDELLKQSTERYGAGEEGIPRPKDSYVEEDKFKATVSRVLNRYRFGSVPDLDVDIVTNELYTELMKAGE